MMETIFTRSLMKPNQPKLARLTQNIRQLNYFYFYVFVHCSHGSFLLESTQRARDVCKRHINVAST